MFTNLKATLLAALTAGTTLVGVGQVWALETDAPTTQILNGPSGAGCLRARLSPSSAGYTAIYAGIFGQPTNYAMAGGSYYLAGISYAAASGTIPVSHIVGCGWSDAGSFPGYFETDGADKPTQATDNAIFVRWRATDPSDGLLYDFEFAIEGITNSQIVFRQTLADVEPPATKQQIAAFMLGRANQLASNQPGLTHFLMGEGCRSLNANITEKSGSAKGCVTRGNTWAEITGAWSDEGTYTLGTVGAHNFMSPNLLLGGMAQFDYADDPDNYASGRGWMVGPYFVAKTPNQALYFEGRLLYGQTDNEITPLQTYTDKFRTERWLAQVRATGEYKLQSTTLMPLLDVTYTEDRQKTYTDSLGNTIATQTVDLMQASAGLDFSTPIAVDAGHVELIGGIKAIYSLTHGATTTPAFENWRGKAHLGLNYKLGPASSIRFVSFYDGLGTRYKNYGANLSLYWKF